MERIEQLERVVERLRERSGLSDDQVERLERVVERLRDGGDVAVRGRMQVWLNGELVNDQSNLIVTAGHEMLAHRFWTNTSPPGPISHVGIGTDNTAEAATNTSLGTQVHRKATATFTRAANVLTVTVSFGDGEGSGLIAEAGLFNAATGGTMFARTRLNPTRQKNSSDTLDITWTLTF